MKGMKSNLHEITCLEDGNGKTVSEPSKIKNMIEDYISNLFNKAEDKNEEDLTEENSSPNIDSGITKDIPRKDFERIKKSLPIGKAMAEDLIPNEFLRELGPKASGKLWRMFNKILQGSIKTPKQWNTDRSKMLHKGGNKSKRKLDNYRTISIGSNIGKFFTRILNERLTKFVEENNLLGEIQGGFRKGRSPQTNLIEFLNFICKMELMKMNF